MSYITVIFAMSADVLEPDMTRKTVTGASNATAPRGARLCFYKITKCDLFSISVSGVSHAIVCGKFTCSFKK